MSRAIYWECNAGISGDMAVAAMLDLGASESDLMDALSSLPFTGYRTEIRRVMKNSIECCDFNVILDKDYDNHDHDMDYLFGHAGFGMELSSAEPHNCALTNNEHNHHVSAHSENETHDNNEHHHHKHRSLNDVIAIIDQCDMTERARSIAHKIFRIIAEAESKAHGQHIDQVHFHEVGAVDSIIDVVALAVCFDNIQSRYGVTRVYVPYLCEGTGTVRCQHGILPVPVPAVANIVSQYHIPIKIMPRYGEFVTPTGAAFIAATATDYTYIPEMTVANIGLGAGKRSYECPSIVRVFMSDSEDRSDLSQHDFVCKLETNIDDCTGEMLGFVMEELIAAGARDVHFIPCYMKKHRPAYLLTVICDESNRTAMENVIFTHTASIGIRRVMMERTVLPRQEITAETELGIVRVKEVIHNGRKSLSPEYDDIAQIVKRTGRPFGEVERLVLRGLCRDN